LNNKNSDILATSRQLVYIEIKCLSESAAEASIFRLFHFLQVALNASQILSRHLPNGLETAVRRYDIPVGFNIGIEPAE